MDWYLYEKQCLNQGFKFVCGIDEAGRGPLYGAVFAAAVVLPENTVIEGLNDSKKLSEKKRESLYDEIIEKAAACGIAFASAQEVDEINILNATYRAMHRAYNALPQVSDFALIDGNKIPPGLGVPALAIVKGDAKSASIAAASILAKVSRDRYMREEALRFPGYGLEKHKGYPTKAHYEAIKELGILKDHRRSFLKNLSGK